MEVIDLGFSDLEPISINLDGHSSSSLGPGIELLMNDRKKPSQNINIDLGDLDNLEKELNNLSGATETPRATGETKTLSGFANNLFSYAGFGSSNTNTSSSTKNVEVNDSKLGSATAESASNNTKTWDGFSKMNDIPFQPSGSGNGMTEREKGRKKRAMIKKLDEWYEKGSIKHSSHFNNDSPYEDVEDEYETAQEDKRKKDSVKLQGWWFMTAINSLEYANAVFNPFDLNLDGWGEQINEDIDSYEEIFSELHDKYKGGKLSPELSLLLRLGFSAAVINITNKALSTATPGFNDVIRQSPELMKMFTNATVQSMNNQSPSFGFANNLMNPNDDTINTTFGAPPPPVETKHHGRPSMVYTEHPGSRPDLAGARGQTPMFREQGVDINNSYENASGNSRPMNLQPPRTAGRPEMRGPQNTDINNILSGLKPNTSPANVMQQEYSHQSRMDDNDSMVSIGSLKDLQNSTMPKNTKSRKQRSDKNTISLDI
jgi:hypothetical protein